MTKTSLKIKINSLLKSKLKAREFGFAKGKIKLSVDFDKPLDELKKYQ